MQKRIFYTRKLEILSFLVEKLYFRKLFSNFLAHILFYKIWTPIFLKIYLKINTEKLKTHKFSKNLKIKILKKYFVPKNLKPYIFRYISYILKNVKLPNFPKIFRWWKNKSLICKIKKKNSKVNLTFFKIVGV